MDLDGPGPERVRQRVRPPAPVGGGLAGHHPHRDPIHVPARPHPHDPGHVLVAAEPAAQPGQHHGGAPPDPVGPQGAPQTEQGPAAVAVEAARMRPPPAREHDRDHRHGGGEDERPELDPDHGGQGDEGDEAGAVGEPPDAAGGEGPVVAGDAARRRRPLRATVLGHAHGRPASRSHSARYAAATTAKARANATCPPAGRPGGVDELGCPGLGRAGPGLDPGPRPQAPPQAGGRHGDGGGPGPEDEPGDDDHQGDGQPQRRPGGRGVGS